MIIKEVLLKGEVYSLSRMTVFMFLIFWLQAQAAPDGTDLLRACETSVVNGFRDMEGQICEYYIIPCDCDANPDVAGQICLPDRISTISLAEDVIDGLRKSPALLQEYAGTAAGIILAERYPCISE